jgi:hypothetical protein
LSQQKESQLQQNGLQHKKTFDKNFENMSHVVSAKRSTYLTWYVQAITTKKTDTFDKNFENMSHVVSAKRPTHLIWYVQAVTTKKTPKTLKICLMLSYQKEQQI